MLVMTLHQSRLTSLLTTALVVFTIAAILAYLWDSAEPKHIVGATAAYAAMLVVFVEARGGGTYKRSTASSNRHDQRPSNGIVAGTVVGPLAAFALSPGALWSWMASQWTVKDAQLPPYWRQQGEIGDCS